MKLLGFSIDRTILDEPCAFDALAEPFYYAPAGADMGALEGRSGPQGTGSPDRAGVGSGMGALDGRSGQQEAGSPDRAAVGSSMRALDGRSGPQGTGTPDRAGIDSAMGALDGRDGPQGAGTPDRAAVGSSMRALDGRDGPQGAASPDRAGVGCAMGALDGRDGPQGTGSGVGCLVVHGIGGTPANVRVVADALARRGYTVYAPLLPGHGRTVRALNDSTGEQWRSCVRDGYDRLRAAGCTRIVPVGLSLGGILCGLLAAERDCAALVLISAPLRMRAYLHFARLISPIVPAVRNPGHDREKLAQKAPYGQMYAGFSTKKLVDLYALIKQLRRQLGRICCPTLALWARYDDKVAKSAAGTLAHGLTHAPLTARVMERSPHGSTYDPHERDLVAQLCADFIADATGRA